jgi:hypothetical protein
MLKTAIKIILAKQLIEFIYTEYFSVALLAASCALISPHPLLDVDRPYTVKIRVLVLEPNSLFGRDRFWLITTASTWSKIN